MSTKVGFVSLGCPKNQVDAECMMYNLRKEGYEIIQDAAMGDVVVVNTCGFIESAKQEAIDTILEFALLKNEGRIKAIVVTGCLAERYRDEILKEIPEVDAVVGIGKNKELGEIIRRVLCDKEQVLEYGEKCDLDIDGRRIISTEPFYAYLKIAEGCDNRCTYCAIPSIRGGFRSRTMESVVKEAEWLASVGVREIVVVAQDTTRYGEDIYGKPSLAELLKRLCKIDGIKWIRTLYAYPERITDELVETIKNEPKLVKYVDMPIQHCSDAVLKRMNRKGNRQLILDTVKKLRENVEGIVLRTTLIAGFPGETEEQFEELCGFVKEVRFDRLGCFAYSREEGTPAASMKEQLDEETKEKRAEIIMEEQSRIFFELNELKIGETVEVVCEGFDRLAECYFGRSAADAPEIDGKIFFTSDRKLAVGEFVRVRLDDCLDFDLIGERVD